MRRSSPKANALPDASTAMVWRPPTLTDTMGPASAGKRTRTGAKTSTWPLSSRAPMGPFCRGGLAPHWPHWLPPTQKSSPACVTKEPCSRPMPICFTPPVPQTLPHQPGRGKPGTARPSSNAGACVEGPSERCRSTSRIPSKKKVCPSCVSAKILTAEHWTSTKRRPLASPPRSTASGPTKAFSVMPSPQTKSAPRRSSAAPKFGPKEIFSQPGAWPSNQGTRLGQSTSPSAPPGMPWLRPHT
mmetsp:Transcript_90378/g.281375  ORF Transcript_90378/g.281375 Transcript_90378/m.281375 type:complete len:243 (+) Transcript_90378:729-1457(+)